jgi:hypothetical protein
MRMAFSKPLQTKLGVQSALGVLALCATGLLIAPAARAEDSADSKTAAEHPDQKLRALQEEPLVKPPPEAPAPPAPKANQQEPRPYVPPVEQEGKEHHLTLMGVAGVWQHGFNGNTASSSVGPVWGVSSRVDAFRWLGMRISILRGNQPVSPDASFMAQPNASLKQADFQIISWTFRLEPTWHATKALSLWAGVGIGWARAIVPALDTTSLGWRSADRACVYVEGQWALGAQYELIRDWVVLDLDLSTGDLGYQRGSAHDPVQAFTPEGHRTHISGYPYLSRKAQGLFGIGIIL